MGEGRLTYFFSLFSHFFFDFYALLTQKEAPNPGNQQGKCHAIFPGPFQTFPKAQFEHFSYSFFHFFFCFSLTISTERKASTIHSGSYTHSGIFVWSYQWHYGETETSWWDRSSGWRDMEAPDNISEWWKLQTALQREWKLWMMLWRGQKSRWWKLWTRRDDERKSHCLLNPFHVVKNAK